MFLHKNEERFTEAQRKHMDETLALLMQHGKSSGDVTPSLAEEKVVDAVTSKRRSFVPRRIEEQEHVKGKLLRGKGKASGGKGAASGGKGKAPDLRARREWMQKKLDEEAFDSD